MEEHPTLPSVRRGARVSTAGNAAQRAPNQRARGASLRSRLSHFRFCAPETGSTTGRDRFDGPTAVLPNATGLVPMGSVVTPRFDSSTSILPSCSSHESGSAFARPVTVRSAGGSLPNCLQIKPYEALISRAMPCNGGRNAGTKAEPTCEQCADPAAITITRSGEPFNLCASCALSEYPRRRRKLIGYSGFPTRRAREKVRDHQFGRPTKV
jgi:hypothetical protein